MSEAIRFAYVWSMVAMVRPGGFVLSNDKDILCTDLRRSVLISSDESI